MAMALRPELAAAARTQSAADHLDVCCRPRAELFKRILAAPILFFLRTPVGDVLNAFGRDQVRCLGVTQARPSPVLCLTHQPDAVLAPHTHAGHAGRGSA